MTISMMTVQLLCRALATNVFFRKSFLVARDWPLLVVLGSIGFSRLECSTFLLPLVAFFAWMSTSTGWTNNLANINGQDFLNLLVSYFLYSFLHSASVTPSELWTCVLVLSLLQVARNPPDLVVLLRPVRVPFGPVSFVLVMVAAAKQCCPPVSGNLFLVGLCVVSAGSTFVAIVILRPDNHEVLKLLSHILPASALTLTYPSVNATDINNNSPKPDITIAGRRVNLRKLHGKLNMLSLAAAAVNIGVVWVAGKMG